MKRLEGRTALVTGSSRGIGLAIARAFLAEGARVAVNSRDARAAKEAAEALGEGAFGLGGDVANPEVAHSLVRQAAEHLGGLDILVNNAGRNVVKDTVDLTAEEWQGVIDLNLTAPFHCSQEAARVMIPRGGGAIINIASVTTFAAFPRRAPYATSKAGLFMLTRVLAVEWAAHGIRVNAISPGFVKTALTEGLVKAGKLDFEAVRRRTPMNRLGSEEEVAAAAVFLASDDASYITGESLAVDGGWLAYGFV